MSSIHYADFSLNSGRFFVVNYSYYSSVDPYFEASNNWRVARKYILAK
jgi:hypothetical protein